MAHIVLCWELGGHLGHLSRLTALADGLHRQGHRVDFIVKELQHVKKIAGSIHPYRFYQAPFFLQQINSSRNPANLSEILLCNGYLTTSTFDYLFNGWKSLIELLSPDLLVFNYAPTAQIANHLLGIPAIEIGTPYLIHPHESPMPNIGTQQNISAAKRLEADQKVLESINTVLADHKASPLKNVSDIFQSTPQFIMSFPELDCFEAKRKQADFIGPIDKVTGGIMPQWPNSNDKPKVFAYLKAEPKIFNILQALKKLNYPVNAYITGLSDKDKDHFQSANFYISEQPFDMQKILAESKVMIANGGHGVVAQALMNAIPVLNHPLQYEQLETSISVYRAKLGHILEADDTPDSLCQKINGLLNSTEIKNSLSIFAQKNKHLSSNYCVNKLVIKCEEALKLKAH